MIDAFRMAQKLHNHLVAETSKLQQKIVLLEALRTRFGDTALPTDSLMQGYQDALLRAPEQTAKMLKRCEERIAENIEAIMALEQRFAEHDEADMEALAAFFKARRASEGKRS